MQIFARRLEPALVKDTTPSGRPRTGGPLDAVAIRLYQPDTLCSKERKPEVHAMFLIIPVGVQYTARRYPVVTFTLMGVNVTLYLVSLVMFWMYADGEEAQREWMVLNLGLIPEQTTWYTFFTSRQTCRSSPAAI